MYLAIFVLLAVAGSWSAWRSNPMYSGGKTLRGIAIYLLMITALVLSLIGVIRLTSNKPPAVAMTVLFTYIGVATMAMIWGIMKLSNPKVSAVPASVETVHFYRRKIKVWVKRLGWSLLVLTVLGLVIPGNLKYVAFTLDGFLLFLGIILLFTGYFAALNQDRALTALKYSSWVHWQYTPQQWQTWIEAQVARTNAVVPTFSLKKVWKWLTLSYVGIAVGVFVFCPGAPLFKGLYVGGVLTMLSAMIALSTKSAAGNGNRLKAVMQLAGPEVFFGEEGIFCDGVLMPWISSADWLLDAAVDETAPRNLVLQFEKIVPGNMGAPNSSVVAQRVLLPENAAADLARLQQELVAKCPKANVAIC